MGHRTAKPEYSAPYDFLMIKSYHITSKNDPSPQYLKFELNIWEICPYYDTNKKPTSPLNLYKSTGVEYSKH